MAVKLEIMNYRIVIIGAGPGGYETAVAAAKKGMEVVLVSEGPLGGTCLNEGCIPTKTLVRWASSGLALADIQVRKQEVVNQLRSGIEFLMKNPLISLVEGRARLVRGEDGKVKVLVGDVLYEGDRIIIATGSTSASLPVPGAERCITSKEMLELDEVPERLCIIGGGVIGLEFASIFNQLGSKVTVLEYCKQILPRFDTDIAKRLKQCLTKSGIEIKTGYQVTDINEIEADRVLMAVGRRPAVGGIGLEDVGVEFSARGIVVDENMQTSVPGVYAIGDVVGGMMLAHVASFQGKRALNHIMGETDRIRFDIVPAAVFTTPEVATVGLAEEDCKAKEIEFCAYKSFYRANGKAVSMGETDGYCKILAEKGSGRILGAHIMGAHSSDMIHEICALMNLNATVDDMRNIIHAHPTLSEVIQLALPE